MTTTPVPAGAPGRLAMRVTVRRVTRTGWLVVAGIVVLAVVFVAGIALGSVDLPPSTTIGILLNRIGFHVPVTWPPTSEAIVLDLRLPRVLTAMVVGTGLAVAGATFQGLLRNPLADPYVLGTASGAALGAAIAVLIPARGLVFEFGLLNLLAFVGALASVTVVYRLSRKSALAPLTSLLLTGYAVGSLLAAGLAMAMYLSGTGLRQIFAYLLGGFDGTSWARLAVAAPLIIGGSLLILLRARSLNGFLLGEEVAAHLGVDVRRERAILLGLASLVTAAGVAVAGLIGFVGPGRAPLRAHARRPQRAARHPDLGPLRREPPRRRGPRGPDAGRDPGGRDHRGDRGAVLPPAAAPGADGVRAVSAGR